MLHNAEHSTVGAVTAEVPRTPVAGTAGQIDLAGHPPADPSRILRSGHLTYEFMPRRAAKSVVAALELEIRRTDSSRHQAYAGEAGGQAWQGTAEDGHPSGLQMNSEHSCQFQLSVFS